jgi:SAM-dependent methyltransferase
MIKQVLYHPSLRQKVYKWWAFKALYGNLWTLPHPFDHVYGTDTSNGFDPTKAHTPGPSQPSIVRSALSALPSVEGFSFVDIGCGRGRVLIVASEFPFSRLLGVEYNPTIAEAARKNAAILLRRRPERVAVQIEVADARVFPLPEGNLVLFFYNSFGPEVMLKVIGAIEAALADGNRTIYVVSYNPVLADCFDASPKLVRYFAAQLPYAREELGCGPDEDDCVVIWQGGSLAPAHPGADARIHVRIPGVRADLASLGRGCAVLTDSNLTQGSL